MSEIPQPTVTLPEICAAIARRHGGEWVGTHEALADRLVETLDGMGLDQPGAVATFRFFSAALTPVGRTCPLADGASVRVRIIPASAPLGQAVEITLIETAAHRPSCGFRFAVGAEVRDMVGGFVARVVDRARQPDEEPTYLVAIEGDEVAHVRRESDLGDTLAAATTL